ncbi:transcriptional regulator family: Fungal Specific TF [Penicillium roqueforti]|nr:transcriptional regulator family: Fungal Specific TF [Penicillium roqueforti]KAI3261817.1 transcriptional regulator family: Fungal Specific TF [Penicillium roqueforti]KAI3279567.1 transcriptional regulator family: Fungal Specific TF [Penicillium roqueforti]
MCAQCAAQGLVKCVYPELKTVKARRQLQSAELKNASYEEFLREISHGVDTSVAQRIAQMLQDASTAENDKNPSSALSPPVLCPMNDTDSVGEDLNRSEQSRATGYMGKNSDVAWMRQLEGDLSRQERQMTSLEENRQYLPPTEPATTSVSYHHDRDGTHGPHDAETLDAFALPTKELADHLLHVFLKEVHTVLPIIREDLFTEQFQHVYLPSKRPNKKWLAVFNMVLAIGSRFCHASPQNGPEGPDGLDSGDEQRFLSRAKALNYYETYGDLQQVQTETLMAFYFLSSSQINRSWKTIGIATRSAIGLGLNLEISSTRLDAKAKEARKRLWWSIFYLEHTLTTMTGRVSCLGDGSPSVSPTSPFESMDCAVSNAQVGDAKFARDDAIHWSTHQHHEQIEAQQRRLKHVAPSPSLYLFYLLDLSLMMHAITNRMYNTDLFQEGLSQPLRQINLYNMMLDRWVSGLHGSMAFEDDQGNPLSGSTSRYQVSLALHYYSSRIVLNRPCLMGPTKDKKSGRFFSRPQFGNNITSACRASLSLVSVLPDLPDARWPYDNSPWWIVVHHLMQATSVLLLYISVDHCRILPGKNKTAEPTIEIVIATIKKALFWLCCLGEADEAARRAFRLCNGCYHRIAAERGLSLDVMFPIKDPFSPPYWQQGKGPEEAGTSASRSQNEDSVGLYYPVLNWTPGLDHDVGGDDTPSRDPNALRIPLDILQNPFAGLDIDVDITDLISQRPTKFEDSDDSIG